MKPLLPYRLRTMAAGSATLLAILLVAWIGGPAAVLAQVAAPVLSNAQVTEDALVDALAIEPAYVDDAPAVPPAASGPPCGRVPHRPSWPPHRSNRRRRARPTC